MIVCVCVHCLPEPVHFKQSGLVRPSAAEGPASAASVYSVKRVLAMLLWNTGYRV